MRVGSVVFATEQGLGYLAKEFYEKGIINKVVIREHSTRKSHYEWYKKEDIVKYEELLETCDTLLFIETPHDWKLIPKARDKGVKTILIPMYECTRYPLPYEPDLIIVPSLLDHKYYNDKKAVFLPIPVNTVWKERKEAKIFVHNAGNGGLGGRNGTKELIEALRYTSSPFKLIIRSQIPLPKINDERVEVRLGTFDDIWSEGDVFIFPEKFNGLSLPLQEAFASGMLVMCGDRFPMNTWLPTEPLIPIHSYKKERIAVEFDSAIMTPQDIAMSIDKWYGKDITKFSLLGKDWGMKHSWEVLKAEYLKYL